ncbi:MAG TPA: hypothetical protein ENG55_00270, partial [Candidatus Omnitrophica bacterium]|nr:hypothetical protein [Candidatus Omnitrophota bacterium]
NVFWKKWEYFNFPAQWEEVVLKKRDITFAWGPNPEAELSKVERIEFAISRGLGGKGEIYIDELSLQALYEEGESTVSKIKAKASSCEGGEYTAGYAVDGNRQTRWSSEFSDPQWLEIDLGESKELVGVTLNWETAYGKAYDILLSEDGKDWEKVYTTTDGDGSTDDIYFKKKTARFLKIFGRERGTAWGYSLWEVSVKGPDEEPIITASSSKGDCGPENVLDGDMNTKWQSGDKGNQWIKIDLRRIKVFGGLFLYWGQDYAKIYEISTSNNGEKWKSIYSMERGNGGSDKIYFNRTPARFIKIDFKKSATDEGYVLKEITIKGPDEFLTPQKHYEILAEELPKGYFPRWLYKEQAFWTVVGIPEDFKESLLCEDGSFEPYKGGFSLIPYLYLDGKFINWKDVKLTQSLEKDYLPIPSVRWDYRDIIMDIKSFAYGKPGESNSYVKYTITNRNDRVIDGKLFLVIRPFQINPPWQPGGGLSQIKSIRCLEDASITINNRYKIYPLTKPDNFGACSYEEEDILYLIEQGKIPSKKVIADKKGYASGVIEYDFSLRPKQDKDFLFVFPLHNKIPPLSADMRSTRIKIEFERMYKKIVSFWESKLDTVEIDIPEPEIVNTLKTNIAYILINQDGPAIQPGSRTYESAWIRDGSMTCAALLRMGITEEVKKYIDWYAGFQYRNGRIPAIINHTSGGGFKVNPLKEYDSQGEMIFAILQYYYFTKDKEFLEEKLPVVISALKYLEHLRDQRITDEYKDGPIEKRKFYGILPNSVSHEGYFPEPGMHSYWDDFWALKGWKDAREIALILGRDDLLEWINREEQELKESVYDSIRLTMEDKNIDYIPGCAEKGDFDATSTAIAVMVCDELDNLPQPQLKNTFDKYYADLLNRFKPDWKGAFTPYEIRTVQAFVYMNQKERAWKLLRYLLGCRRPLNWNHLAEVVFSNPRLGQYIGDMPHTWVGSGYINAVRSLFVYEKDGRLILGGGIPEEWLSERKDVSIGNLPTYYGNINYTIKKKDKNTLRIKIWGDAVPPTGFIFKSPLTRKIKEVELNGKKWKYFLEDNIMLDKLPVELEVKYEEIIHKHKDWF